MPKGPKSLDASAKKAAELDLEGILLLLGLLRAGSGAILEPIERELVLSQLRIDHGCRLSIAGSGIIQVIEFLTRWRSGIGLQLRRYHRAAELKYSMPVACQLVLLSRKGVPRRVLEESGGGEHRFRDEAGEGFRYEIHKMWEIPAGKILKMGRKEMYPFVALSAHRPEDVVEADRRLESARDLGIRARLRTFSGVNYSQEAILELLGDGGDMLMEEIARESSVVKAIARKAREQGFEQGREEGREEGLEKGLAQGLREAVRGILSQRFPELTGMREIDHLDSAALATALKDLFSAPHVRAARQAILRAAKN